MIAVRTLSHETVIDFPFGSYLVRNFIQAHDPNSVVFLKNIRVKPLK
ncbi:MAG: hypothetical protein ACI8QF_001835 [Limisphaerales bacterium]